MVICFLGFLLVPGQSYACSQHTKVIAKKEKTCCSSTKEQPHVKENCEKECCKSIEKNSKDCSGKCGSNSCQGSSHSFSATPLSFKAPQLFLSFESGNSYMLYKQPVYSSNVSSIWQPPKIS